MSRNGNPGKIMWVEGLRVLLAIIVFVHHFMMVFLPDATIFLYNDGQMAVVFFMLLTGAVIPLGKNRKTSNIREICHVVWLYIRKRYIRLLPTIVVSILLSYVFLRHGLYSIQQFSIEYQVETIAQYFNFKANAGEALFDAFIGSFYRRPLLNTPLWTIKYEFWGAVVTYIIFITTNKIRYKHLIYILIIIVYCGFTKDVFFPCILIGMSISEYFMATSKRYMHQKVWNYILSIISVLIYMWGCYMGYGLFAAIIATTIIMIVAFRSKTIQKILGSYSFARMGKYTFQIYAMHWPIICSFSCAIVILLDNAWFSYKMAILLTFIMSIVLTVFIAIVLNRAILRFLKVFEDRLKMIDR